MSNPQISVIIPNFNSEDGLARSLPRLAEEQARSRLEIEVIVVDNGSATPPAALCAQYPFVTLAHEATPGPGPARSHGARLARAPYLAFVDADCQPLPGWLTAIKTALDQGFDIIGGDVRIAFKNPQRPDMIEAYEAVYGYRNEIYIANEGYSVTANLAMQARSFATVGPFGGIEMAEDIDWGKRATRAGLTLKYIPEMIVETPARGNFDELRRKWDRHVAHLYEANPNRLREAVRAVAMLASPPAELLRVARSERISGFRARALAWICVTRTRFYRARRMLGLAAGIDPSELANRWRS